jgi:hypothetical protein
VNIPDNIIFMADKYDKQDVSIGRDALCFGCATLRVITAKEKGERTSIKAELVDDYHNYECADCRNFIN